MAAPSKKQSRKEPQPTTVIVCGLYVEGKTAVARGLLKELKSAMVIASDAKAGRQAAPKQAGSFEVGEYTKDTPQPPPQGGNVVVLAHELAQPSRVAAAMARDDGAVRLLGVIDARSFLDDWEDPEPLPPAPDASKATLRRRRADSAQAQSLCHHDVALFKGRGETTLGDCFLLTSSLPSLATC